MTLVHGESEVFVNSILVTIKQLLGIQSDYEAYDSVLIPHINSVFAELHQLGVGPDDGFVITGVDETWDSYIEDKKYVGMIQTYVYLKVKLLFDPPETSTMYSSMSATLSKYEWQLNAAFDKAYRLEVENQNGI